MTSYGTLQSIQSLGIIYACVSRDSTILAVRATFQGNFSDVVPQILAMIPNNENGRLTYTSGEYMFHYVSENGVIFLCITDDDFERSKAFLFLEDIKNTFFNIYGDDIAKFTPYSLNTTFGEEISRQLEVYAEDSYLSINGDPNQIRLDTIRVKSLDMLSQSGELEQLELMESEDNISLRSFEAQIMERRQRCQRFCQRNYRIFLVLIVLSLVFLIIIFAVIIIAVVDEDKPKR